MNPEYETPKSETRARAVWRLARRHVHRVLAALVGAVRGFSRKAFMQRQVENIGLFGGLAVVIGLTVAIHALDPTAGFLPPGTLQVLALVPVLFFLVLHTAIYTYKHFLPDLFKQLVDVLSEKLTQTVLPDLDKLLPKVFDDPNYLGPSEALTVARFKIYYHLLKFFIRCVRYLLYFLPLYFFAKVLVQLVVLSLSLVPH